MKNIRYRLLKSNKMRILKLALQHGELSNDC
jgi:hypothetical protein